MPACAAGQTADLEASAMSDSARRWLNETYRPIVEKIPQNLQGRIEEAQFFHEVLEHRWYLSEREGHDVGLAFSAQSFIDDVLPFRRDSGSDSRITHR